MLIKLSVASQSSVSYFAQNNPRNHTGVGAYQREIARFENDVSLVKGVMILLGIDDVVDEGASKLLATVPDFIKFLHENQIDRIHVNEFRRQIVFAIESIFQDSEREEHTRLTMMRILIFVAERNLSTKFAQEIVWVISNITYQNPRNQRIFASDAIRNMLIHLFWSVPKNDNFSELFVRNITKVILNISWIIEGRKILSTPEIAAILDVAWRTTNDNLVLKNIARIRTNLSLL